MNIAMFVSLLVCSYASVLAAASISMSPSCENNGQCVNGLCLMNEDGEGVCSCDLGFQGEYCHEKVCKDGRCGPHGVCLIDPEDNSPECKCMTGYTGSYCQEVATTRRQVRADGQETQNELSKICAVGMMKDPPQFYFASRISTKFIQCDGHSGSFLMPCAPGTVWSQEKLVCVYSRVNTDCKCGY